MHEDQLSLLITTCVFLPLSIIVIVLRCWARVSIRGWGYDDALMVIAEIFFVAFSIGLIVGCRWGMGVPDKFLTLIEMKNATHAYTLSLYFYVLCFPFVKTSICLTLIRIAAQKTIRRICYAVIVWSVICSFVATVVALDYCHPIDAMWTLKGHCGSPTTVVALQYIISITAIVTDFTCAILPSIMLWKLQMKRKLKITVVFVLSLGFLASAATLVRQRYVKNFVTMNNRTQAIAAPSLWSAVELGLGIISGSLPVLRPLLARVFRNVFATTSKRASGSSQPDSSDQRGEDLEHQATNMSLDIITVATNTEYADSYISNGGVKSTFVVEDMSRSDKSQGRSV